MDTWAKTQFILYQCSTYQSRQSHAMDNNKRFRQKLIYLDHNKIYKHTLIIDHLKLVSLLLFSKFVWSMLIKSLILPLPLFTYSIHYTDYIHTLHYTNDDSPIHIYIILPFKWRQTIVYLYTITVFEWSRIPSEKKSERKQNET